MNKKVILAAVIALAIGLGGGYLISMQKQPVQEAATGAQDAAQPLFYRHPMNPEITSPVPVKDEMGMDYVPVYADGGDSGDGPAGTVKIDPVIVQNIGVRTARAERRELSRAVRAVGRVGFDEEHLTRIHPKIEGWIEMMRVDKTGEKVKKDQVLLGIYSPQMVSSQEEYLLAIKNLEVLKNSPFEDIRQGAVDLVRSSRERLELLDMAEHQIRELEESGKIKKMVHIHSPFDGVVINVGARDGQFVTPRTELYRLADLSKVWGNVDLFENDLPWVKEGDKAEMRVAGVPGRIFRGKITYIYPYFEPKTRTVKVRLEFDNRDGLLKPDMFADVTIQASRQANAVVVPTEAIVRSGSREQIFVVRAPGKFEPREVTLGVSSEGMTQVLSGVAAGEEVVTSAQFLIDSESKLREATAKMMEAVRSTGDAGKDMEGMDMSGEQSDDDDMSGMNMDGMDMNMDSMDMDASGGANEGTSAPLGRALTPEGMQHD